MEGRWRGRRRQYVGSRSGLGIHVLALGIAKEPPTYRYEQKL
jgi:hypothetical protein